MLFLAALLFGCGDGDDDGVAPPATLISISVSPADTSIAKGTTLQFAAIGRYSDGFNRVITSQVSWTSSNSSIATVNSAGLATAKLTTGSALIVATLQGISGSATLNVADVSSLSVFPAASIAPGTRIQYTAIGFLSGSPITQDLTSYVTWSSSNSAVALITSAGLATGLAAGSTDIEATFQAVTGTEVLTVAGVASISVSPLSASIPLGTTQKFSAMGTLTNGATQVLTSYSSWSSSDISVATVGSTGLATSVSVGSTSISATYLGIVGLASLEVKEAVLVSISVAPSNAVVAPDEEVQFSAMGKYTDSSTYDITDTVVWESSNTRVALISSTGLVTALSAGSTTITAKKDLVSGSTSLTVSTEAQRRNVYVTNSGSNTVSVIDASSNTVLSNIAVGTQPTGIALDTSAGRAYIVNTGDGSVSVIDTSTNTVIGFPVKVGNSPEGVAVHPVLKKAYVTNNIDNTVSVISVEKNSVIKTIQLGPGSRPRGVAVDALRSRAYVTNSGSETLTVIDTGSDTVVGAPVPVGGIPIGVTVDSASGRVYTANNSSGTVSVIDAATDSPTVIKSITLGPVGPWGVSVYPAAGRLYVTNNGSGTVSVIDTVLLQLTGTIVSYAGPKGIALDTTSGFAYAANSGSNTLSVIDTAGNRVVALIRVGGSPEGVAAQ